MQIFRSKIPIAWEQLNLPLYRVKRDWFGSPIHEPCTFSIVLDPASLCFIGIFPSIIHIHPDSLPGQFTPELWKYDVSELFLANPRTGQYLEFNLTANGAWWAAKFDSPRILSIPQPDFTACMVFPWNNAKDNSSSVILKIPLDLLENEIDFGLDSAMNFAFIRDTPSQRYLSAAALPGSEPDFHQPNFFLPIHFTPISSDSPSFIDIQST
jgi:hypothetical protein